ncbi:hypothetical protein D4Z78_14445 [Okeania hirsuta]|nr:hypothetical protein D4Z78_14445 [Okeania hirsuta]
MYLIYRIINYLLLNNYGLKLPLLRVKKRSLAQFPVGWDGVSEGVLSRAVLLAISNQAREEIIFPDIQFRNGLNQR